MLTSKKQQEVTSWLSYAKDYLQIAADGAPDEDFMPELMGMVERVGVILSGVKAGFYTEPVNGGRPGVRLTTTTEGTGDGEGHVIVGDWVCTACDERLEAGDIVNHLDPDLEHINCERPQG